MPQNFRAGGGSVSRRFARQTNFLARLRDMAPSLPKAERVVARAILDDPEAILALSISDLAERSGVGDATVVRMARRLGLSGYQELKILVAADRSPLDPAPSLDEPRPNLAESIERIVATNVDSLRTTQQLIDVAVIDALSARLDESRLVAIYGVGTSALAGRYLAYRLTRMGIVAEFEEDSHYQAMSTVLLDRGSVAVAFSQSGSTYSVVQALAAARGVGAFTAAITRYSHSPLSEAADAIFITGAEETPFLSGALPGLASQLCIADIVAVSTGSRRPERAHRALRLSAQRVADMKF